MARGVESPALADTCRGSEDSESSTCMDIDHSVGSTGMGSSRSVDSTDTCNTATHTHDIGITAHIYTCSSGGRECRGHRATLTA